MVHTYGTALMNGWLRPLPLRRCWDSDMRHRPSADELVQNLNRMIASLRASSLGKFKSSNRRSMLSSSFTAAQNFMQLAANNPYGVVTTPPVNTDFPLHIL